MRVAYADPPYPGRSAEHYADHPDFAGEVDHVELIDRLERDYPDGWALSTGAKNLQTVLALCPPVRVLIWRKPHGKPFRDMFIWSYEPVLLRRCRKPAIYTRDVVEVQPDGYSFRPLPSGHVIGRKPKAFCEWLFAAMGLGPEDELFDLYPGTGAVGEAFMAWKRQLSLGLA